MLYTAEPVHRYGMCSIGRGRRLPAWIVIFRIRPAWTILDRQEKT